MQQNDRTLADGEWGATLSCLLHSCHLGRHFDPGGEMERKTQQQRVAVPSLCMWWSTTKLKMWQSRHTGEQRATEGAAERVPGDRL